MACYSIFEMNRSFSVRWEGIYPTVTLDFLNKNRFDTVVRELTDAGFELDFSYSDFNDAYTVTLYSNTAAEQEEMKKAVEKLYQIKLISPSTRSQILVEIASGAHPFVSSEAGDRPMTP